MRKLVAPLAAAGALPWLPGQAALGKRPEHPVLGRHDSRSPPKQRTQEDTMRPAGSRRDLDRRRRSALWL
jgi:hypothetical protein